MRQVGGQDSCDLGGAAALRLAQGDDRWSAVAGAGEYRPEISVSGDEHSLLFTSQRQHLVVGGCSKTKVTHVSDVVASDFKQGPEPR